MRWKLAFAVLVSSVPLGWAVAPLRPALSAAQESKLAELAGDRDLARQAGQFDTAQKLAEELLRLRERWQGAEHWQTVNARWLLDDLRRLAALPKDKWPQAVRAEALLTQGELMFHLGRYPDAEASTQRAITLTVQHFGEEHPLNAVSYNNAAVILNALGKFKQALPLAEKSLSISKKMLGEYHPHTAKSYTSAANAWNGMKKFDQALPLAEKAIAIRKKCLGETHPDTAAGYNNLAFVLNAQMKHAEAQPVYEKALVIWKATHGEEHPDTARSYTNVASTLNAQGLYTQAQPLFEKALAIWKRSKGEQHPLTAGGYNNLAFNLQSMGKFTQAQALGETALAITKRALGEGHPQTATSYNNLAVYLQAQGKYTEAQPLHEKALAIRKSALGEDHPDTAASYNNLAFNLDKQGKPAAAQVFLERALAIWSATSGVEHQDTAMGYNNVAGNLRKQGKHAQAQPLYERAHSIWLKSVGPEHPLVAMSLNNIAINLDSRRMHSQAQQLHEKALAIHMKVLGEEHPRTAANYDNLAFCLHLQNQHAAAQAHYEKSVATRRKVLGAEHPETARSLLNLATSLHAQEKYAQAQPLLEQALATLTKSLGAEHPMSALCSSNLGLNLYAMGKTAAAVRHWQAALPGYDAARIYSSHTAFDRSLFGAVRSSPRYHLAIAHAQQQPLDAWRYLEESLGRDLLDDLTGLAFSADTSQATHLAKLDEQLLSLFGHLKLTDDQKNLREELARQRRALLEDLNKRAAARSADLVLPLSEIQKRLPADAAFVVFIPTALERFACVLRREGDPVWIRLEGSGRNGTWTAEEQAMPESLAEALANPAIADASRERRLATMKKLAFDPLAKSMAATHTLPAARRLIFAPIEDMGRLPWEVLAEKHIVSYATSGTLLARSYARHRPLATGPVLALGDPVFDIPERKQPRLPESGLFVKRVVPKGKAALSGIQAGDVLLQHDKTVLSKVADLQTQLAKGKPADIVLWRNGERKTVQVQAGVLGVDIDLRPLADSLKAHFLADTPAIAQQKLPPLPGSRLEVEALARLFGAKSSTLLLGSEASESSLEKLATTKKLSDFRFLHLATHGEMDLVTPCRSALALSRDRLPTPTENLGRVAKGQAPFAGHLRIETILSEWKLDADLVTLSACETALGPNARGNGLLGFGHALMSAGARTVVLSRWKVRDDATALLMVRFYENLLGKGGVKTPLPRAEALSEARAWLRDLSRKEAEQLTAAFTAGKMSSTRGPAVELLIGKTPVPALPPGEKPFAHPTFWAAWMLVGDAE